MSEELLSFKAFKEIQSHILKDKEDESTVIVDFRSKEDTLKNGLIPGSISIHAEIPFERFIGNMITSFSNLAIVTGENEHKEIMRRLNFITYKKVLGHFNMKSWLDNGEKPYNLKITEDPKEAQNIIDVREQWEWSNGVVDLSNTNFELIKMKMLWSNSHWKNLNSQKQYTTMCAGGVRSFIVASYLNTKGIKAFRTTRPR